MIAFAFTLPYHVMRSAAAAGVRVHVLGGGAARKLRTSRCCRAYQQTRFAGDPDILLAEIDDLVRRRGIDIVFPADDKSARLLATLKERLPARCVPLPEPAVYDLLNDKWRFTQFCAENGIRAAEGHLYQTLHGLRRALAGGQLTLPITLKPVGRCGGVGARHIHEPDELDRLDAVGYRPILAQRHIVGDPVGITIQCDRGRLLTHVIHQRDAARFRVVAGTADLLDGVTWLATLTRYHGVAHFDAVLSRADRRAYLIGCSPQFWCSVHLAMIAGLNVFDLALSATAEPAPVALEDREICLSLAETLAKPWRASRLDWSFVRYCLTDPFAFALLLSRTQADGEDAADVAFTGPLPFGVRPSFTA